MRLRLREFASVPEIVVNELLRLFEQPQPKVVMRPPMNSGKRDGFVGRSRRSRRATEIEMAERAKGDRHRACTMHTLIARAAPALLSLTLLDPSYAAAME